MKAICIERFGGSEVLKYRDVSKPTPGNGEVLVRVSAASVNPRDWLLQEGRYQFKSALGPFPIVLGSDFSGTVETLGNEVSRFKVGDEVFGMQSRMGAFAEWIVAPESILAMKPREMSHADAAAIPCAALTAFQSLVNIGRLRSGQSVLVNGATGGVGGYAVQIAKALGGRVTAVASQRNADLCRNLGADQFIDRATMDFNAVVREQDIILDAVGRSNFSKCKRALASGGHYVTTTPNASVARTVVTTSILSMGGVLPVRRCHMVLVRSRPSDLDTIAALAVEGRVRSLVAKTFPLADAANALADSKGWRTTGKLVLQVRT